jgi:hypothetical protein
MDLSAVWLKRKHHKITVASQETNRRMKAAGASMKLPPKSNRLKVCATWLHITTSTSCFLLKAFGNDGHIAWFRSTSMLSGRIATPPLALSSCSRPILEHTRFLQRVCKSGGLPRVRHHSRSCACAPGSAPSPCAPAAFEAAASQPGHVSVGEKKHGGLLSSVQIN